MRTWEVSIGHGFRCYDYMFMVSIFLWNFVDYARLCCDLFRDAMTEFCFFIFVFTVVFRIFRYVNVGDVVSFCGGGCVMMHSGAGHLNVSRVFCCDTRQVRFCSAWR